MAEGGHWALAAEDLPLPTLVLHIDGRIERANAAAARLLGRSAEELRTTAIDRLLTGVGRMLYHTQLLPTLHASGHARELSLALRDAAGTELRVLAYATLSEAEPDDPRVTLVLQPPRTGRDGEDRLLQVRRAADASPGVLFEYQLDADGRGRFNYASAAIVELFGLLFEQVRENDSPWMARIHPEDREALQAERGRSARLQSLWAGEFRAQASQGGPWAWMAWHAAPRAAPGGGTVWHGFAADVTRQREMARAQREREASQREEAARREAEAFIRLVADSIPGRVAYWDLEHVCRFANARFCDWKGLPPARIVGASAAQIIEPDLHRRLLPHLERALAGERQKVEYEERRPDAEPRWWLSDFVPDLRAGEVRGVVVMATEVTSLKASERQLEEALQKAEEATRSKSTFLANMSHEIRTPMNAIIGLTHLMSRDSVDTVQRERLGKIDGAAHHLLQIINDVLDLSKIEAGKLALEDIEFGVDSLLGGAFDLVGDRAREKGLELVLDSDGLPGRLRGDPTRLSQVIVNLLSNAVKFTERGWVRLRASLVREDRERRLVRFEVTDTGEGIAPEHQARIFQSFEQADVSTTRRHGGTGLGLSIARQLAGLMGGELGLESEPGRGSTFWFTAWLDRAREAGDRAAPLDMEGLRALLVDDLPEAAAVIEDKLRLFGFEVDTLHSGPAAIERLRAELRAGRSYDVFLVDWRMEPMDGIETLRALRAQLGGGAPPCLLVTAFDEPGMRSQARAVPCQAVLLKPITASALHDGLVRVLRPHAHQASVVTAGASDHAATLRREHAGQRVLLAEDNPINQEVAFELLGSVGLVVETASDGVQALELASARDYDLVLMDVQMPRLDGLEATRRLRTRRGPGLPIVAMTANAFGEDRAACLEAGMNDHVSKPVDPERLYATLLRWLPRRANPGSTAETAAQAQTPSLKQRLGGVRGLNLERGLRNVGGSPALLERMLRRFLAAYREGVPALGEVGTADQRRQAVRTAHFLRGSAATVGAVALADALERMESGLVAAPDDAAARVLADPAIEALRSLVQDLEQALG